MKSETKVRTNKTGGKLNKPRASDPVAQLKGLAEGLWPDGVSSVQLVRELRSRADFKATEKPSSR